MAGCFNDVTDAKGKIGNLRVEQESFVNLTGIISKKAADNDCQKFIRLQEAYLKGRLEKQQLDHFNLHLQVCAACSTSLAAVEELLNILFCLQQPVTPAPQVRASLLRRIKQ